MESGEQVQVIGRDTPNTVFLFVCLFVFATAFSASRELEVRI